MYDKKDKNSEGQRGLESRTELPLSRNVFASTHGFFAYKRTQRLTEALYLVTDLIPKEEYLGVRLRERSVTLLSDILDLQKDTLEKGHSRRNAQLLIFELVGLLEVARTAGHISEMNFALLKKHYLELAEFIQSYEERMAPVGALLPRDFFDLTNLYGAFAEHEEERGTAPVVKSKGHVKDISRTPASARGVAVSRTRDTGKQNERRTAILEHVRKNTKVTVKDVAGVISGCSEKTIQRELIGLVQEGILRKEGERRWSTYSLA